MLSRELLGQDLDYLTGLISDSDNSKLKEDYTNSLVYESLAYLK